MRVKECLKDLSQKDFCHNSVYDLTLSMFKGKVSSKTIKGWLKGESAPKGTNLIRLITLLELLGYEVSEVFNLSSTIRVVKECFVFNIISRDYMSSFIFGGFSQEHIIRILLGKSETTTQKMKEIQERIEPEKEKLFKVKKEWEDHFSSVRKDLFVEKEQQQKVAYKQDFSLFEDLRKDDVINFFQSLIMIGTPIAKELLSEKFTPEDRRRLRRLTGENGVFDFKNLLARLCSEQAKKEL